VEACRVARDAAGTLRVRAAAQHCRPAAARWAMLLVVRPVALGPLSSALVDEEITSWALQGCGS
jgi:hypothetical protein